MSTQLTSVANFVLPVEAIAELCRKYEVEELDIFGSILREDFGSESDVDFLVVFRRDDFGPWMSKLTDLQDELSALLGRRVDVVSKHGVEESENYIRRKQILSTARTLYVA